MFHLTLLQYPMANNNHTTICSSSYTLGIVFIVLVSIIWSAASVLTQNVIYCDYNFHSPFLLTLLGSSLFVLWLPFYEIRECHLKFCSSDGDDRYFYTGLNQEQMGMVQSEISLHEIGGPSSSSACADDAYVDDANNNDDDDDDTVTTVTKSLQRNGYAYNDECDPSKSSCVDENENTNLNLTKHETFQIALVIAPLWLLSNVTYNLSLEWTSISSSTVLASTGSLFAFCFAVLLRDENFSMSRLLGVLLFVVGSIITGYNDASSSSDDKNTCGTDTVDSVDDNFLDNNTNDSADDDVDARLRVWGDLASLLSAVGYGAYTVALRKLCPKDESRISMELLFGYVGLINIMICGPVAIFLCIKGVISVSLNTFSLALVGWIVVKGLFDNVISDYLWARSVVLTSATVASVGVGLTIPLAFVSDIIMQRWEPTKESIIGGIAVLLGFLVVTLYTSEDIENAHNSDNDSTSPANEGLHDTSNLPVKGVPPSYQRFSYKHCDLHHFEDNDYINDEHGTLDSKSVII